jgi:photosystem II stability/assembly factor-like uncharacterized protein
MLRRAVVLVALLAGLLPGVAWPSQPVRAARLGGQRAAATVTAPSALVGAWMNGTVSLTAYRNVATGEFAPTSGTGELYSVSAAGRYEWVKVSQESLYNCTSLIASDNEGTVTAGTTSIVLNPKSNVEIGRFSCQRKQDYERTLPLERQVYQWRLDSYQRGTKLCLLREATKAEADCLWSEAKLPERATTVSTGSGAAEWASRAAPTPDDLVGVSCGRGGNCLAAGYKFDFSSEKAETPLVSTADGGATWSSHPYTNSGVRLRAVSCSTAGRCVLVGDATWTAQQGGAGLVIDDPAGGAAFHGISCTGNGFCVAVGQDAAVLTTANGGGSWTGRAPAIRDTFNALYAVSCPSASLCVAVGEEGTIVTSTDGGTTWTSRSSGSDFDLDGVACASTSACTAVGGTTILVSTNGGTSWDKANQPAGTYASLQSVTCAPDGACLAVGSDGAVLASTDGGSQWASRPSGTTANFYAVTCPTGTACTAVGQGGTVAVSADGGNTWSSHGAGTAQSLYGVSCTPSGRCLASGTGGTVLASTDGGATWDSRASGTTDNLWGVACPTAKDCLVGSMHGVLVSTDGGTTWPGGTEGLDAMLSGVSCPNSTTCVAVGSVVDNTTDSSVGAVLTSADGGASWTNRSLGTTKALDGVSCASANMCTAVGANGTVLTSSDGGATWATRQPGSRVYSLYGVSCTGPVFCVAVGGSAFDAVVLKTNNGGVTWASYASGFDDVLSGTNSPLGGLKAVTLDCVTGGMCGGEVLRSVSCPSSRFCAAVGDQGTLLTTDDGGTTWTSQVAAGGSSTKQLTGVSCLRATDCVAVGQGGTLLRMS